MSFAMIKPANSGGWIFESHISQGRNLVRREVHIAATPEALVDHVLAFAARTSKDSYEDVPTPDKKEE